ncbi:MAG: GNAT family N-acetyltransferase [Hyphomicrobiaceae bacterium]|nr:GNAT family N-acetyltransferase [Hyphomicrobiaceae bacterium]
MELAATPVFRPVTPANSEDFVRLFESKGGPSYCWCVPYRTTAAEKREADNTTRKAQMLRRIEARVPVGLLGYLGAEPVCWVSVGPKSSFVGLGGPAPESDQAVWSLTCLYVPRAHRHNGWGRLMIEAAIREARADGATHLEAYPVDPQSPSYRFFGFVPLYERLGFSHCGMEGSRRHVMRLKL